MGPSHVRAVLAAAALTAAAAGVYAQEKRSVWDGVYSDEQAARGKDEYEVPADFDLSAHVGVEEFLIEGDAAPVAVTIETDEVATWLLERRLRGAGTLSKNADGTGVYEVEVRSEEGFLRWLAEFGAHVRITSPVRLADAFHERLAAARALYAQPA